MSIDKAINHIDSALNTIQDIKKVINELNQIIPQPSAEWVSIKDKLPNDNERYLTIDKYKIISIEHFMPFDNDFIKSNVTHWMPLPSPPKAESE